ncbi:MAG: metallophosphoesterase [Nanoarchaeota archaeon]
MKDIKFIGSAIYLRSSNILVISDIHIGYEESLAKKGILMPKFQLEELITQLKKIFNVIDKPPDKIILNGDVKHEFGKILAEEWRYLLNFFNYLKNNAKDLILIRGNHDKLLSHVAIKSSIKIRDFIIIGDILITHGDKLVKIPKKINTIIIGHQHPSIRLTDDLRSEIFKCYLIGRWKLKNLIVQPSFHKLTIGTNILSQNFISPFLKNISNFEVITVSDRLYNFGKFKNLIE